MRFPSPRRTWLIIGVPVLLAVGLAVFEISRPHGTGCTPSTCDAAGLPLGPVSYAAIQGHPEAHLQYPGSSVVQAFGEGERSFPGGQKNSAFSGDIFATPDTPEAVYRWYEEWLRQHGWQPYEMSRLSTERSVEGYARGARERFDVAMEDPATLAAVLGHPVPADKTVFEARYIIFPASG